MKRAKIKAKWAAKVARADNFIVITDKESALFAKHTNPDSFMDLITANMQLDALRRFQYTLNEITNDFENEINNRFGVTNEPGTSKKRTRKIPVKQVK